MATGWIIGVMVDLPGEPAPLRHYYAVAKEDRAQAEWAALDMASLIGGIATSPVGGVEPVDAVGVLAAATLKSMGLSAGQTRDLGWRWPRKWLR